MNYQYLSLVILVLLACTPTQIVSEQVIKDEPKKYLKDQPAKFEPPIGKVLVFTGQDNESIGGISPYNNGYVDHFPVPAGVTLYTGIGGNDGSFGGKNSQGLQGIYETMDPGNGPSNMSLLMEAKKFEKSALAIGFSMVNNEEKVAAGELDDNIKKLGEFLLSLGERPVFLRIGYEFDGHPWNHYDKASWVAAYKRIKDKLDAQGVTNTAYVWQSVGWVSDPYELETWYPGDEYVDWCGFSFFDRWREVEMLDFARKKKKPVFIAESSATISSPTSKFDGKTKETILSNPAQAQEAWEKWFVPYFDMIENNLDVIKAIHYINCNWKARPMWFDNPTFQDVDARIQESPLISQEWKKRMNSPMYLNAIDNPFGIQDQLEKFEPPTGKCILFVGQDLESIGGLNAPYNDGYLDHFPKPGGFTMYTGFSPGQESFGYTMKGLDGVWTTDDWGDSDNNMSLQLADEDFKNMPLCIGLWMTDGNEKKVASGEHDAMVDKFGNWLKSLAPRPVFLRIGYEFHGPWNNYDRESYLTAYRRIKDRYDELGVENVAYVWQSHGFDEPDSLLQAWYPGNDYVDWCSYSFFARWQDSNMIEFARQKGKPVFIAEATPTIGSPTVKKDGKTIETILSNPQQATQAWEEWFDPFFKTIKENEDVVKAVSYINCHWKAHPMWFDNPHFQDVDARLQTSDYISKKWLEETSQDRYKLDFSDYQITK